MNIKSKIYKPSIALLACLTMLGNVVFAQTKLQVITKTIKKTLPWKASYKLNIYADLADINIQTWEKSEVGVEVKISSKHTEKSVAEEDLEKMEFVANKYGNGLYLRNYVVLDKGDNKPKSNLKAVYTIYMPANCPLSLSNHFGSIAVKGLQASINAKTEFCSLALTDVKSDITIDAYFGDNKLNNTSGTLVLKSNRSDVVLHHFDGSASIGADYADIDVNAGNKLKTLKITAQYSDIMFNDDQKIGYSLDLVAENGRINHPDRKRYMVNIDETKREVLKDVLNAAPSLNIFASNGNITLLE